MLHKVVNLMFDEVFRMFLSWLEDLKIKKVRPKLNIIHQKLEFFWSFSTSTLLDEFKKSICLEKRAKTVIDRESKYSLSDKFLDDCNFRLI